ncbi:MAG: hypothetical protein PHP01_04465 [Phycisphaerae bacterium]|nr:hypothetical protein [Phycisphaerae bacterium]
MRLPEVKNSEKYKGLYVVDFGGHCGVGFTAQEAAELLESEKFKDVKVYKIYKAYPDGRMELKGVPSEIFQLETGMFFYQSDEESARNDFKKLINSAIGFAPPAKAKVHLAKYDDEKFAVALIFPAEFNDEFGQWLLDIDYKTNGSAEGGIEAAERYYADRPEILERHQLFAAGQMESKTGAELLGATKMAVVR